MCRTVAGDCFRKNQPSCSRDGRALVRFSGRMLFRLVLRSPSAMQEIVNLLAQVPPGRNDRRPGCLNCQQSSTGVRISICGPLKQHSRTRENNHEGNDLQQFSHFCWPAAPESESRFRPSILHGSSKFIWTKDLQTKFTSVYFSCLFYTVVSTLVQPIHLLDQENLDRCRLSCHFFVMLECTGHGFPPRLFQERISGRCFLGNHAAAQQGTGEKAKVQWTYAVP